MPRENPAMRRKTERRINRNYETFTASGQLKSAIVLTEQIQCTFQVLLTRSSNSRPRPESDSINSCLAFWISRRTEERYIVVIVERTTINTAADAAWNALYDENE